MKQVRKIFLAVWIPVIILVCLATAGNVGKEREVYGEYHEVVVMGWTEVIYSYITMAIASVFLFWLVGAEEINGKRIHGKAYC